MSPGAEICPSRPVRYRLLHIVPLRVALALALASASASASAEDIQQVQSYPVVLSLAMRARQPLAPEGSARRRRSDLSRTQTNSDRKNTQTKLDDRKRTLAYRCRPARAHTEAVWGPVPAVPRDWWAIGEADQRTQTEGQAARAPPEDSSASTLQ